MPTYEEWLRRQAEEVPVEPEPTPIPAKPTVTVVNKSQQVLAAGMRPRAAYSRVVSIQRQITVSGVTVIAVSEIVGQEVKVLRIQVKSVWNSYTDVPIVLFELSTGMAKDITTPSIEGWDRMMRLIYNGHPRPWPLNPEMKEYDWTMCKKYVGSARRFALGATLVGEANMYLMVSFEISEG